MGIRGVVHKCLISVIHVLLLFLYYGLVMLELIDIVRDGLLLNFYEMFIVNSYGQFCWHLVLCNLKVNNC